MTVSERNTDALDARLAQLCGRPAAEFLVHRDSMLLLDRLVRSQGDSTECEWQVEDGRPFVVSGCGIPAYVGVEYMAQCIAVHAGARARLDGLGPPLGFLLGTRHYRASLDWFPCGTTCRTRCVKLIRDANGMGAYDCIIRINGSTVAKARLSVVEKERGQSIDE